MMWTSQVVLLISASFLFILTLSAVGVGANFDNEGHTTTTTTTPRPPTSTVHEVHSPRDWLRQLNNAQNNLIVVQFYLPHCPFCQRMKPEWERIAREVSNNGQSIKFLNFNASRLQRLAWHLGLRSVPTYKFYRGGNVIDSIVTWNPYILADIIQINYRSQST